MKRRRLILGSATLLGVMLLFAFLFLPEEAGPSSSFVSGYRGRWGNFQSDDDFTIMWVTNNASISIGLEDQIVQWEQGGKVISDVGTSWVSWDGKGGPIYNLPAKSVACLPFEVPKDATRFRVQFRYSRSGGRLRKAIGGFLQKLPYNRLPPDLQSWLLMNGLIDGRIRRQIEGPWMPNNQRVEANHRHALPIHAWRPFEIDSCASSLRRSRRPLEGQSPVLIPAWANGPGTLPGTIKG